MDEVRDGHALDHLPVRHEVDGDVPPERRWLGVKDVGLAGVRGQVHGHRIARVRLRSAVHLELAADLRAVVLEVDLDRGPRAGSRVALEQHPGIHVQRPGSGARERQRTEHDDAGCEQRPEAQCQARASAVPWCPKAGAARILLKIDRRQVRAGPLLPAADPRRRAPPRRLRGEPRDVGIPWPRGTPIVRFRSVPSIRPFRALRYSRELVDDLSAVVAPPYDVIGPEEHRRLLARDPRNVVRTGPPAGRGR